MLEQRDASIARVEAALAGRPIGRLLPDVMTPDHPLAKALGFEVANPLVDTPARRRSERAATLRESVARLSREGKLVREIAAELGVSYSHVVALRMALGVTRRR
ncbi:hypothetical protein BH09PSE4_BH09PSE4_14650 [soil metagenome]